MEVNKAPNPDPWYLYQKMLCIKCGDLWSCSTLSSTTARALFVVDFCA